MTDTEPLYDPDPLVTGLKETLSAHLPDGVKVDQYQTTVEPPCVNLWPTTSTLTFLTMGGPQFAEFPITARSIGRDVQDAVKLGTLVRLALREDSRGKLINPVIVAGGIIDSIRFEDGHLDDSGATPVWVETLIPRLQSTLEVTPPTS